MIACASSRGFFRAAFARRNATLLAKSPCWASRVRSTKTVAEDTGSASNPPATLSTAVYRSCSRGCFKGESGGQGKARQCTQIAYILAVNEQGREAFFFGYER